jgi:hypothetical protein
MKRVATIITILAFVGLVPFPLVAQDRSAQFEERLEQTRVRLNLTDAQLELMAPALEESMATQQSILASYGIDLEDSRGPSTGLRPREAMALRRDLQSVREETLEILGGILTEEQLEEFRQIQEERSSEMRERIRGGR